jgi:pyruvate dehydrogenase E2 component (dihydrolipoamide acetyltransferase)
MTDTELRTFTLPDVGEGLVEARIEAVLVEVGDQVARFDVVVEVETDKAVVELNTPWSGTITQIHVKVEDYVPVGGPVFEISLPVGVAEG